MVVDASIWVSWLVRADINHTSSAWWLARALEHSELSLVVPTLALPEVGGAIARLTGVGADGERAITVLLRLPGLRLVSLDAGLGEESARTAARLSLRGADAVYVTVAHTLGLPLITWDAEIHARAAGFIDVVRPQHSSEPV